MKDARRKETPNQDNLDLELKNIFKDIKKPEFYTDIAELEGMELI